MDQLKLTLIKYKIIFNSKKQPAKATMLLAIDVGNSHTVIGLFQHKKLIANWRIKTVRKATSDELASMLHGLLSLHNLHFTGISDMIIGSVVPTQLAAWRSLARNYLDKTAIEITARGFNTVIKIAIDNPAEAGADRIINAVAGYTAYSQALIIIDFGTAITFDCVSEDGKYLGGAIAPGMGISIDALASQTAKLPRVDISAPPGPPIGTTTETAIRSGLLYGFGSMVEGMINKIKEEMAPTVPRVIATGGMADIIAPHAPSIEETDQLLPLKGLLIIYEHQS